MPFPQFLPYCCDKTCLLPPQFFVKGESSSRSLTFLARSLKNKGNPKDLEQMPRIRLFREGGTARGLGRCEQPSRSPVRSWLGLAASGRAGGPGPGAGSPEEGLAGGAGPAGGGPRAGPPPIKLAAGTALPAANPAVFSVPVVGSRPSRPSRPCRGSARRDPRLHLPARPLPPPRHPPPPAGRGGHVPAGLLLEYLLRRLRLPGGLPHRRGQLPAGTCPLPGGQRQEGVRRLGRGAHRHRPRRRRLPR